MCVNIAHPCGLRCLYVQPILGACYLSLKVFVSVQLNNFIAIIMNKYEASDEFVIGCIVGNMYAEWRVVGGFYKV